ncbi:hypothetical protein [Lentzea guizhouensis]|uniref:hypothetical protein n=1 Tax=Lentzea guizhouensis TaxID=1586287 RepID=UPI001C54F008
MDFFGSSGINLLLAVQQQAWHNGVPFAVVAAHNAVVRPLQLTRTDKIFSLFPTAQCSGRYAVPRTWCRRRDVARQPHGTSASVLTT